MKKLAAMSLVLFFVGCAAPGVGGDTEIKESYLVSADSSGEVAFQLPDWQPGTTPIIQVWAKTDAKFSAVYLESTPMVLRADGVVYVDLEPEQDAILVVLR